MCCLMWGKDLSDMLVMTASASPLWREVKPPAALIRRKSSLESSVGQGEEYEVVEGGSKAIKKVEIFRVLMLRE